MNYPMIHWSTFPGVYFLGLSGMLECLDFLQMAVVWLDRYPPGWKSPHDWPVNLAIEMITSYIFVISRTQLRPSGSAQFISIEKPATLWLFITPDLHLYVIITCDTGVNCLKWQAIQLVVLCRVGQLKEIV